MAYDVELAHQLRELLGDDPSLSDHVVTEKAMFGGLAFLVDGHMALAAGSDGGMLLRVDPDQTQALLADPQARPMEMRGREMTGWLHVQVDDTVSDADLARWVGLGLARVRLLPPKR